VRSHLGLLLAICLFSACQGCRRAGPPSQATGGGRDQKEAATPKGAPPAVVPTRQVVRLPPIGRQVAAHQLLVAFHGSTAAWATTAKRSREEALAVAQQLAAKARSGTDFVSLARDHSDWPFASRNEGALGVVTEGNPELDPALASTVFDLKVGEVSNPVASPLGYYLFKRDPMHRGRQILIAYSGVPRSRATRTRAEAEALVARLEADLKAGKDFGELAFESSDDLGTAGRGGDLGGFVETSPMLPPVRKALTGLKVDEISAPVDSPLGFHILQRTE
jgi:peptidyl-prolyl cis-trans isomerase SurA